MAVAWIGDRDVPFARAVEQAAELLVSSLSPVFSLDTDVHGARAAIFLAGQVGAAYDHVGGDALARETALCTDRGGMFIAPGEVRRRADVIVLVGELPAAHSGFVAELATVEPDLDGDTPSARRFFVIGDASTEVPDGIEAVRLSCDGTDINGTLAALRAQCLGRPVTSPVSNFDDFAKALADGRFPVFISCGQSLQLLALEMLQGLIADINRTKRASALHLPASESGWGSTLASVWMTGFPMRTSHARGLPEFDPWRFDVSRMLADGEADLHICVSASGDGLPEAGSGSFIALTKTEEPVPGAAVTIAIGEPEVDHDAVAYSSRIGTLTAVTAKADSGLPSAAMVLRSITESLPGGKALPC
ncbi:tungsten formylmethanofuran dehydrogenase [Pseudaminobacter sp. NGMCC 1.201702]|uniref:tungsten formylmethanofuran dehydrogenase n=1 Tax=Pseudaminobacter sp. NGMCC 1.201702 TaxID=3391825 RepID=UPI0039F0F71E